VFDKFKKHNKDFDGSSENNNDLNYSEKSEKSENKTENGRQITGSREFEPSENTEDFSSSGPSSEIGIGELMDKLPPAECACTKTKTQY